MAQKCIPLDSSHQWKAALAGIKHSFFHTWEYCNAVNLTTNRNTFLYFFEKDNIRIICPLQERVFLGQTDVVTPYGFSGFIGTGNHAAFPHYWKEFVLESGYVCGYIGLNPLLDEGGNYFEIADYHTYNNIYVIDLTPKEKEIFSKLSQNRKRQIKKGDQHIFNYDKEILVNFFLDNYHDFMEQKQAAGVYGFSRETLVSLLSLDNLLIIGAGQPHKVEAVSLFGYTSHVADYLFNISLAAGRHHSVPLIWSALKYLKSINIPCLNLGGGVRENDSLAEFKERFGAEKLPLKSLKQIYNQELYQQLCEQVKVAPDDKTGYFPAYRKASSNS